MERLDPRLKTIAGFVRKGSRLADIGCDHGLLIAALASDGVIPGGIACDVNPKPLDNARRELARRGLSGSVECRLGDGLKPLLPSEADDIVIAGMGGELIASILEQSGWQDWSGKRLILQPMSRAAFLRRRLMQSGFSISSERACAVGRHVYTVIQANYTGESRCPDEYDLYCHTGLLAQQSSWEAGLFLKNTLSALKKRRIGVSLEDEERENRLSQLIDRLSTVLEDGGFERPPESAD